MFPSSTQTPGAAGESSKPTEAPAANTGSAPAIPSTSTTGTEGY
ncbi:hypothetical protein UFOVP225_53 [uncultured Caudovirales phage]|uniref:Uncharacterized protein n=1 Tax=uncultured Caudovirales phage TaxID=2100421 RepID=A0A6J5L7G3_9CAUD|nr:hypothetical protein UFOVP113_66 [uncultured Caudovirales phage]CAB5219309.1 hypothetical protein UFOVP225_53 [uncultured Caudovirales phage]